MAPAPRSSLSHFTSKSFSVAHGPRRRPASKASTLCTGFPLQEYLWNSSYPTERDKTRTFRFMRRGWKSFPFAISLGGGRVAPSMDDQMKWSEKEGHFGISRPFFPSSSELDIRRMPPQNKNLGVCLEALCKQGTIYQKVFLMLSEISTVWI